MALARTARPAARLVAATMVSLLALATWLAPGATAQHAGAAAAKMPMGAASVGAPSPNEEAQFVARVNSLRASKGLSQLAVSGELTGVARNWTERMAQNGQISHNPNLGSQVSGNWTKLGENVGVGYDVDGLMQAFINSSAHYRNLVDPAWTHIGVGVTIGGDGRMYTTHNFMAMGGSAPPPPAPPAPPSSTRTTRPPSTATTAAPAPTTTVPPTTTTTEPPRPHPTTDRVTAVLDPLRSLEAG